MGSKVTGLLWVLLAFLLTAGVVAGIPFFARSVPWSFEQKVANQFGEMPGLVPCRGAAGKRALEQVVTRLFPLMEEDSKIPLKVEVVSGKDVNAFATLGARIYIYDGLIQRAQSPEELAGVIAHEIEHLRHRHVLQGVFVRVITVEAVRMAMGQTPGTDPKLISMLMNLKFSREQEYQADFDGLTRLKKGRVDVSGFRRFFEREAAELSVPEIISDHPAGESRAALSQKFEGGPIEPILDRGQWAALRLICQ